MFSCCSRSLCKNLLSHAHVPCSLTQPALGDPQTFQGLRKVPTREKGPLLCIPPLQVALQALRSPWGQGRGVAGGAVPARGKPQNLPENLLGLEVHILALP